LQSEDCGNAGSIPVHGHFATPFVMEFNLTMLIICRTRDRHDGISSCQRDYKWQPISDYSGSPFCTNTLGLPTVTFEAFKLYSATQCDSGACLIIRLAWLWKLESPSNQKLVATYCIISRATWDKISTLNICCAYRPCWLCENIIIGPYH